MNDINITIKNGGLNRDVTNNDIISGLVIYTPFKIQADFDAALITDITATSRIKVYSSLAEFESKTNITFNSADDDAALVWYQVKEFFRLNSEGKLYVNLAYNTVLDTPSVALTFDELELVQNYSDGTIRQIGVFVPNTMTTAQVELMQSIADTLFGEHKPVQIIAGFDTKTILLASLDDLRALSAPSKNVSVVILQDGDNYGLTLYTALGYSIPAVGATLGAVSFANVNESIAWVRKFNMSGAGELAEPAFGDGTLVKNTLTATLAAINLKGYLFGVKHIGISGTYFNDNPTCDVAASDYAYMGEVRTMNKVTRNVRSEMLPELNSPIKIDSKTGYIDKLTITNWTNKLGVVLNRMVQNAEISAFKVFINPNQNILLNSTVNVVIQIVPYGTARNINIEIGFTVTI